MRSVPNVRKTAHIPSAALVAALVLSLFGLARAMPGPTSPR